MNKIFNTQKIKQICQDNDISYLGLFGSFSTNTQRPESDIDLLVEFKNTKSLLEKGVVINSFQDLFGREIDLVGKNHIKDAYRPYIQEQLITLYEQ